jgi:phage gp29-like protein
MTKTPKPNAFTRARAALARAIGPSEPKRPPVKDMSEEVAKPSMTGVRRAWSPDSMVDGLTPDRLAALLRRANEGDLDDLLTLAEEMEERDPHYASVLATRKLAVLGLERQLVWSKGHDDHPRADEIHEACSNLIDAPAFEGLLAHSLDAIAKPYAVSEIEWLTTTTAWTPVGYRDRDPRWFKYDKETGRQLRLKEEGQPDGVELKPLRFVVAQAANKSGLPARRGLMRLVAFSFVCKLYGIKDWMAYAEIFGIPLRLGKFDKGATPEDVEVLKRAVFGLGSDAAAVIPEGMTIEFPNLGAAGGAELFKMLVEWLDSQVSKAILGQTGTTDMKAGGYAQAKVQDGVRTDLQKADAKWLGSLVTQQLLAPYVRANFGPDAPVPHLVLIVDEPEDVSVLSEALERLVPLGLEVDQDEVMKKLKLSPPGKGAKLLRPPAVAGAPPTNPAAQPTDPAPQPADPPNLARDQRTAAQAQIDALFAEARARRAEAEGQLDEVQLAALDGWERSWGADVTAVMSLAAKVDSFEAFTAGLAAMAEDLAAPVAARSLANAMFQAAVIGQAQARKVG